MITQYDVYALLSQQIPQLASKPYPSRGSLIIYASMNYFTDFTRHAVEDHNFQQAKKCFALAEDLYLHGDAIVKLLIENSFIYSITPLRSMNAADKFMTRAIIPEVLFTVYLKQAQATGL